MRPNVKADLGGVLQCILPEGEHCGRFDCEQKCSEWVLEEQKCSEWVLEEQKFSWCVRCCVQGILYC